MATQKTIKKYEIQVVPSKTDFPSIKIGKSQDVYDAYKTLFGSSILAYESFYLLLLNKANRVVGYAELSKGGVAGTIVDPIIVAKYAIDVLASNVVAMHNHPSCNLKPSSADHDITKTLVKALDLFNIRLLDHLIVCEEGFYSFADEGLI